MFFLPVQYTRSSLLYKVSHTLLYLQIFHCCRLHSVLNISISHSVQVELSSIYVFKSIIFTVFYILHVYSVSTYLRLQSLPVDLIHVYITVLLLLLNHKVTVKLHCIIITFLCSIFPSFYSVQGCHWQSAASVVWLPWLEHFFG